MHSTPNALIYISCFYIYIYIYIHIFFIFLLLKLPKGFVQQLQGGKQEGVFTPETSVSASAATWPPPVHQPGRAARHRRKQRHLYDLPR